MAHRSEPACKLEPSKTTAYKINAVGKLGIQTSETIFEAFNNAVQSEIDSLPSEFDNVSDLTRKAISTIPGAKNNPLGAAIFCIAGFITKKGEDLSNNQLLTDIKNEMNSVETDIYRMFDARPYAELANALDKFESYKAQGPSGQGLTWLRDAEDIMNVNLRVLMNLIPIKPESWVALDMVSHLSIQGQIYMSILDALCSVDSINAKGYAIKRKSFGGEIANTIRQYMVSWKRCWPLYVERNGGGLFGLLVAYGYDVMSWSDWLGGYPRNQWLSITSSTNGWDDAWVNHPEKCAPLNNTIADALRNRTDIFGDFLNLIATADLFDTWTKDHAKQSQP